MLWNSRGLFGHTESISFPDRGYCFGLPLLRRSHCPAAPETAFYLPHRGIKKTIYLVMCALLPFPHSTYGEHGRCTADIAAGAELAQEASYSWLL
jgi:hypothetical protein